MGQAAANKQYHLDVTGTVDVTRSAAVCSAVLAILQSRYPGADFSLIQRIYTDFDTLYRGDLEGFLACDTSYHDSQHVLDVSLAMARLIDGYEGSCLPQDKLGSELAIVGMIVALFHDSGYIRRHDEGDIANGAAYTKIHVSRSAQFMGDYLPTIGCADYVPLTDKLVHFTGYEYLPDQIALADAKARVVGMLVGTADVIAQMADRAYLQKCRDRLFPEFEAGGMTQQVLPDGSVQVIYQSAEDLLLKTPEFIKKTITERLEGHFHGLYHCVAEHFGGSNWYMESLQRNCGYMEQLIAENRLSELAGLE